MEKNQWFLNLDFLSKLNVCPVRFEKRSYAGRFRQKVKFYLKLNQNYLLRLHFSVIQNSHPNKTLDGVFIEVSSTS